VRLSHVTEHRKELKVKFADGELTVSYYPNRYTPRHEDAARAASSKGSAGAMLLPLLQPLIAEWDLLDSYHNASVLNGYKPSAKPDKIVYDLNTGTLVEVLSSDISVVLVHTDKSGFLEPEVTERPVPVTELGLYDVPTSLQVAVMDAINKAMSPEAASSRPSESSF
jgi:hypothetical protein